MKICKFEGCNKTHAGLGYCKVHYNQFRRTGKTWVIGEHGPCGYKSPEAILSIRKAVSKANFKGGKYLDHNGYTKIHVYDDDPLKGRLCYLHRHLMEQHIGRRLTRNEVVRFKDHDRRNLDISNLQLLTRKKFYELEPGIKRKVRSAQAAKLKALQDAFK